MRPAWDNFAEVAPPTSQAAVASDDAANGASNVINFENLAPPGELLFMILRDLKKFMSATDLPNGPWINNLGMDRVWDWCGQPEGNLSVH